MIKARIRWCTCRVLTLGKLLRGEGTIFLVVLEEKIITNSYFFFFYVYMSKCRQFKGLSTGMVIWTIPNHTIKLQLDQPRHFIIKKKCDN